MLLSDSPDLEELTLEGTCQTAQLWNIRKMLLGRWPRLKNISMGSLSSRELLTDDDEMTSFFTTHPTLENIEFLSGMYYSRTSMFYIPPLPRLHSFTGRIQQLRQAPDLPSLRCLHFTDWFSPSARFADILQFAPHVTSLFVSVNFLDSISRSSCLGLYERLLSACPQLTNLEISSTGPVVLVSVYRAPAICSGHSPPYQKDFSLALRCAPALQTFTITRTRKLVEEDMAVSALRIANSNPHLQYFVIRDVLNWDHHDQLDGKCRFRQVGTYRLLGEAKAAGQSSMRIHETGVSQLGRRFTRSSICELRPHVTAELKDNG